MELSNALRTLNPENFVSHLPVHQVFVVAVFWLYVVPYVKDGSCNGLQHYAALGRDSEGGKKVYII